MKYVRYNMKRKKSDNLIFSVIVILVLIFAFFIGTFLSKLLFRNNKVIDINVKQTVSNNVNNANISADKNNTFITIQCGVYAVKSNADAVVKNMTLYGFPGIYNDAGSTNSKVILGVYNKTDADPIVKTLNDKKIIISTATTIVTQKELCNAEIGEMISGLLQMTIKFSNKEVSSIDTQDFKNWAGKLTLTDKNSTNQALCLELKSYIKNLPSGITKDKIAEYNIYLNKELKKYKQ